MGIFDRFPHSSTHEMNLDFMLGRAQEINTALQQVTAALPEVQTGLATISEKTEIATEAAEEAEQNAEAAQTHAGTAMTWRSEAMHYANQAQESAAQAQQIATTLGDIETAQEVCTDAQTAAETAATNAAGSASAAHTDAINAGNANTQAGTYAANAASSANAARSSATNANNAKADAIRYATAADGFRATAETASSNAQSAATNAQTSATNAATSATNAATAATQVLGVKEEIEDLIESLPADFTDVVTQVNTNTANITSLSDEIDGIDSDVTDLKSAIANFDIYLIPGQQIAGTVQYGYAMPRNGVYVVFNNDSTSWVQFKYPVEAGKLYTVASTLTKQGDNIAAIYFTTNFDINNPVDVIAESQTANISTTYTPNENGYIVVLTTVGVNTRATGTIIAPMVARNFGAQLDDATYYTEQIDTSGYGVGAISSDTGTYVDNAGVFYLVLSLDDTYKQISFKTSNFSSNYGYGFIVNDTWYGGTKTTSTATVTIDVPNGTTEFRLCWNPNSVTQAITAVRLLKASEITNANLKSAIPFPFYPSFNLSVVPSVSVPTMNLDVDEVYTLYDSLVTDYPNWVTKVDCSDADSEITVSRPSYLSGLPIYLYKFNLTREGVTDNAKRIKFMLIGGTHPNERMGIFQIYNLLKMMCDLWKTNETCAQLRTMIDFYVIPCLSPWGYEHDSRVNGNGVNLNRNFPTHNWYSTGSGTQDYTGATAGSEYETQIAMYYINDIEPDIFWDVHTGGMTATGRYGCIEIDTTVSKDFETMCVGMARAISNAWIAGNTDFPDDPEQTLYDVDIVSITGELFRWVYETRTRYSVLTELSYINNWVEGVLQSTTQASDTPQIWKENLQSVYNTAIRLLYAYSKQCFSSKILD